MQYWLMKSEPGEFSLDDLYRSPRRTACWDGVRNYQARNMMRDTMRKGDLAFFYHSNCPQPAIVGIMTVVREGYVDTTAFDRNDKHYDPRSRPERPLWYMVDVRYRRRLRRPLTLNELRACPRLAAMPLLRKGNRLSVMPVRVAEWRRILELEQQSPP